MGRDFIPDILSARTGCAFLSICLWLRMCIVNYQIAALFTLTQSVSVWPTHIKPYQPSIISASQVLVMLTRPSSPLWPSLSPRHPCLALFNCALAPFPLNNVTVDNAAIILMSLPLTFSLRVMFLPEVSSLSLFLSLGVKISHRFCSQILTELLLFANYQNFHIDHLEISSNEKHDHLPRRRLPPYWLYSLPPHSPTAGTSEACCATLLKDHSILWSEADFSRFRRLCLCFLYNNEKKAWSAIIMLSDCIVRSIWRRRLAPH